MPMRLLITLAVLAGVLVLVLGAGGVLAYDRSGSDRIADGVIVGGIPVGGLHRDQATAKLEATVLDPLSRPIEVTSGARTFTLTPERAAVRVDIAGSIARAVAASRRGNAVSRTVRRLAGSRTAARIPLAIAYDDTAVARTVRRVKRAVTRPAIDATLDLEHGDVRPRRSHTGRRLQVARLTQDLRARLTDATLTRTVSAHTRTVQPRITTRALAKRYPVVLIVHRSRFELTLYKDLEVAKTYSIAVGQVGLETPAGLYHIQNKAENPAWHVPMSDWAGKLAGKVIPAGDPGNPIKARWMGIFDGAGIHGTDQLASIGTAASHGCVRMRIPDVEELYDQVPVQTPVYIA
jgi:lipoprotein-anchoring transpeptidase ErfK/SrfK